MIRRVTTVRNRRASITCSRISPRCKGNDDAVKPDIRAKLGTAPHDAGRETVEFARLAARSMSARRRPTILRASVMTNKQSIEIKISHVYESAEAHAAPFRFFSGEMP